MFFSQPVQSWFDTVTVWLHSAGRQIDFARMWILRKYLVVRLLSNRICVSCGTWGSSKVEYKRTMLIRPDDEQAIRDLMNKFCELQTSDLLMPRSAVGDRNANGRGKRTAQVIGNQTRVQKLCVPSLKGFFYVRPPVIT